MSLSDKRWKGETGAFKGDVFLIKDVKEAVKELKSKWNSRIINQVIDEIFGDKLI